MISFTRFCEALASADTRCSSRSRAASSSPSFGSSGPEPIPDSSHDGLTPKIPAIMVRRSDLGTERSHSHAFQLAVWTPSRRAAWAIVNFVASRASEIRPPRVSSRAKLSSSSLVKIVSSPTPPGMSGYNRPHKAANGGQRCGASALLLGSDPLPENNRPLPKSRNADGKLFSELVGGRSRMSGQGSGAHRRTHRILRLGFGPSFSFLC
jgi:hypothetical protein